MGFTLDIEVCERWPQVLVTLVSGFLPYHSVYRLPCSVTWHQCFVYSRQQTTKKLSGAAAS